jgi:hypothetical protein
MRANTSTDLKKLIKNAIDIANDLCYDDKCKEDLRKAQNEIQIENILIAARRRNND